MCQMLLLLVVFARKVENPNIHLCTYFFDDLSPGLHLNDGSMMMVTELSLSRVDNSRLLRHLKRIHCYFV